MHSSRNMMKNIFKVCFISSRHQIRIVNLAKKMYCYHPTRKRALRLWTTEERRHFLYEAKSVFLYFLFIKDYYSFFNLISTVMSREDSPFFKVYSDLGVDITWSKNRFFFPKLVFNSALKMYLLFTITFFRENISVAYHIKTPVNFPKKSKPFLKRPSSIMNKTWPWWLRLVTAQLRVEHVATSGMFITYWAIFLAPFISTKKGWK